MKWKADKAASKKDRVNSLQDGGADDDTEDEDDGDEECDEFGYPFHLKVLLDDCDPVPISNHFQVLSDLSPDVDPAIDEGLVDLMNNFAHHVQVGKKQSQKSRKLREDVDAVLREYGCNLRPAKKNQVILQSEDDLDRADVLKLIQPLPKDPAELNRLATLCPSPKDVPLLPGQKWMIFDTGASCSSMKVSRDCPQYAPFVKATRNSQSGQGAETAGGGSIKERGEVDVDLLIDDTYHKLSVRDMDVSMPIASGRACVASGDTIAVIYLGGGVIKSLSTGKEIQLYARQGVYFFKGSILSPGSVEVNDASPFIRRG